MRATLPDRRRARIATRPALISPAGAEPAAPAPPATRAAVLPGSRSSSSSSVRGQSWRRSRDRARSARSRPPVWQAAQ